MPQNWFKHDYNASSDDKILELRAEVGWEGYGLFWAFIETMCDNGKGYVDPERIGGLSVAYNLPKEDLANFIDTCLKLGLFYEDEEGFIRNKRIDQHLEMMESFADAGRRGAKKRWSNQSDKGASKGANNKGNTGAYADESRLDKSKLDKNHTIEGSDSEKYEIPTIDQVKEYFSESDILAEDIALEAKKFINHYSEKEWKTNSGNRIKKWRRQASTWAANYIQFNRKRLQDNEKSAGHNAIAAISREQWED